MYWRYIWASKVKSLALTALSSHLQPMATQQSDEWRKNGEVHFVGRTNGCLTCGSDHKQCEVSFDAENDEWLAEGSAEDCDMIGLI